MPSFVSAPWKCFEIWIDNGFMTGEQGGGMERGSLKCHHKITFNNNWMWLSGDNPIKEIQSLKHYVDGELLQPRSQLIVLSLSCNNAMLNNFILI